MADKLSNIQEQMLTQEQRQQQNITQQQLLQSALVELPVAQLIDRIQTEMNDNPALETKTGDDGWDNSDSTANDEWTDTADNLDYEQLSEREERQSALDDALSSIGRDDEELPIYHGGQNTAEEREEMVYGNTTSFYEQLNQQLSETSTDERQRYILEYIIGSLDDDGLLRKSTAAISDELAIYHGIDASDKEIEQALKTLQTFDPAGIGARSLQECLLIQTDRRDDSRLKQLMQRVVTDYFDLFTKKHWDKIQKALALTDLQAQTLFRELRRLNPKPGAAMGETAGRSLAQITPDFIVDTSDDGQVTFTLNSGDVPELKVSQSFADSMTDYLNNKDKLSKQDKEALLYIKKKVDAAQNFIEAIKMRRRTLTVTMQAIVSLQHQFFVDGDEASLRPMILRDVAERTGLDLSTISRVSNSKYAQTRWGIFPLRHFFSDSYVTQSGEELSTRQIKAALRDVISAEDKRHPMSDEALTDVMKQKGYPIARRTIAKYREQMGLPVARLRRSS